MPDITAVSAALQTAALSKASLQAPVVEVPLVFTAHVTEPTPLVATAVFSASAVTGMIGAAEAIAPPRANDLIDRSAVSVPIAPPGPVTDTTIFEDPADSSRRLALPRYSLRREALRFRSSATGWDLTVVLASALPAEGTQELEHSRTVTLTYDLGDTGTNRRLLFTEITSEAGALRAVARGTDPEERDWIFRALNDEGCRARLEVDRTITVAVPVTTWTKGRRHRLAEILAMRKLRLQQHPARPVPARARVTAAARVQAIRPGGRIDISTDDVLDQIDVASDEVVDVPEIPTVTRYRVTTTSFAQTVDPVPLYVPVATNPEVFVGITGGSAGTVQLVPRVVDGHVYLQERAGSTTFYYLPDDVRLARHVRSPHYPVMNIAFGEEDGRLEDVDQTKVDLAFGVVANTNRDRLEAARTGLATFAPGPYPEGIDGPQLHALSPASTGLRFNLDLGSTATVTTDGVDLIGGFVCRTSMPLAAFRPVYDALLGGGTAAIGGSVEVPVGGDSPQTYRVPFSGRLTDAFCPVSILDLRNVEIDADGRSRARLVNAIESPIRITHLPLHVRRVDGALVPAQLVEPDLSAPITVEPDGELLLAVAAPDEGSVRSLELAVGGIEVLLDRTRLYEAVIDGTVEVEFTRNLAVKVSRLIFDGDATISSLHIDVHNGDAVLQDRPGDGTGRWLDPLTCPVAVPIVSAVIGDGELPTAVRYRMRALRSVAGADTWDAWSSWIDDDPGGDTLLVASYAATP